MMRLLSLAILMSSVVGLAEPSAAKADDAVFCDTYESCRRAFLDAAGRAMQSLPPRQRAAAHVRTIRIPSAVDSELFTDVLYIPAASTTENLLVLTSGVHGIEGYMGSAMQALFLREMLPTLDLSRTGVLLIHGINPYGMKYGRRVSENNVDLNRNFDTSETLFTNINDGYRKLNELLNPTRPVSLDLVSRGAFYAKTVRLLTREPLSTLRQAILQGQYEYPKGLYFGGNRFEPQKEILEKLLVDTARPYSQVLVLDIHTGYGKPGVLHLFPSGYAEPKAAEAGAKLFEGFRVEDPHGEDFYTNWGDFSLFVAKRLTSESKLAIPMVLEYGTVANEGAWGGIQSLRTMVVENQLHHHGAVSPAVSRRVREWVREMYYPSSSKWRADVLAATRRMLPVILARFGGSKPSACPTRIAEGAPRAAER